MVQLELGLKQDFTIDWIKVMSKCNKIMYLDLSKPRKAVVKGTFN